MKRLVIILSLFALALGTPGAQQASAVEETKATLREHVLKLINRDRAMYNLPPVQLDIQASSIGDDYCRTQIRNRTTGHYTTDGQPPYMRYSLAGGNHGVSENAAAWSANYKFSDRALYEMARRSQDAMMAEMAPNDGHKKTILDPHATHVGIGMAWDGGEFRLVHEFVRRYLEWTRPLARSAKVNDVLTATGRPLPGARVEAVTVHYERNPETMPAHVASAIESYSLPDKRRELHPSRRGNLRVAKDGTFNLEVEFTEGPGVYTVVVWVIRDGHPHPVAASNVSIRVEGALQSFVSAGAAGR